MTGIETQELRSHSHEVKDVATSEAAQLVASVGKVESSPKLDGRNMIMVLAPDKKAQAAAKAPSPPLDEDAVPEVPAASNEE